MKKIFLTSIVGLFSVTANAQQDQHLSQWYVSPALINPACAGMGDETMKFFTAFRTQWFTATPTAYRTIAASFDARIATQAMTSGHFGLGLNFYNDVQGTNRLSTNSVSIPLNYAIEINRDSKLVVGLRAGMFQQTTKSSGLTWDNQWTSEGFDNTLQNNEGFLPSITRLDLGAGVYYVNKPNQDRKIFVGLAGDHLTAQKVNFAPKATSLYRRMNIHGGMEIKVPDQNVSFTPQFYTSFQGPNYSVMVGSDFKFWLQEASRRTKRVDEVTFNMGIYLRWKDALIINGAFNYKAMSLGVAYDANVNKLRSATKSVGAVEVFFKYTLNLDGDKYIE
jgi:type IX secretion system PorP/SprF family membrane protein